MSRVKTPVAAPPSAVATRAPDRFEWMMAWFLPAITALTPLVVIYSLARPHVGQSLVFRVFVFIAAGLLGFGWSMGWRPLPHRPTLPMVLGALGIVSILISLIDSRVPLFSLKQAMLPLCGFLYFCLIVATPERRALLDRLCLAIAVVSVLLSLQGIGQYVGIDIIYYSGDIPKNSVVATIGHPNYLSSVLGPALFLLLSFAFTNTSRRHGLLIGIGAVVILFCIVLTRARSVWLGVLCGFGAVLLLALRYCYAARIGRRWIRSLVMGALLSLLALGIGLFVILPAVGAPVSFKGRFTLGIEIKSRFYYWYAAYDRAMEKPILGQGYAMFDPMFWDYAVAQQKSPMGPYFHNLLPAISGSSPGHVHNEYLEVFCEQGLFGLACQMAFLGFFAYFGILAIMRQTSPARAFRDIAVYGAFVTNLVNALFSFPWRLPISLIVSMVILAWIYDSVYPRPAITEA
ncbi:MAG: O-antigen ligase family protein [bacterium]|nr:O-antigen ligase family protein [bacterium]